MYIWRIDLVIVISVSVNRIQNRQVWRQLKRKELKNKKDNIIVAMILTVRSWRQFESFALPSTRIFTAIIVPWSFLLLLLYPTTSFHSCSVFPWQSHDLLIKITFTLFCNIDQDLFNLRLNALIKNKQCSPKVIHRYVQCNRIGQCRMQTTVVD